MHWDETKEGDSLIITAEHAHSFEEPCPGPSDIIREIAKMERSLGRSVVRVVCSVTERVIGIYSRVQ